MTQNTNLTSLRDIATSLTTPESTLRLYRDEFEEFVATSGQGRRRRYPEESVQILRRIVERKRGGWPSARIREELAREVTPQARSRRRTQEERLDEVIGLLTAQTEEIAMLRAEVAALRALAAATFERRAQAEGENLSFEEAAAGSVFSAAPV
jgi:DNA-binding transcriptional MerR regulator